MFYRIITANVTDRHIRDLAFRVGRDNLGRTFETVGTWNGAVEHGKLVEVPAAAGPELADRVARLLAQLAGETCSLVVPVAGPARLVYANPDTPNDTFPYWHVWPVSPTFPRPATEIDKAVLAAARRAGHDLTLAFPAGDLSAGHVIVAGHSDGAAAAAAMTAADVLEA